MEKDPLKNTIIGVLLNSQCLQKLSVKMNILQIFSKIIEWLTSLRFPLSHCP